MHKSAEIYPPDGCPLFFYFFGVPHSGTSWGSGQGFILDLNQSWPPNRSCSCFFLRPMGGPACPPTQTFWDPPPQGVPLGPHPESISQPFLLLSPKKNFRLRRADGGPACHPLGGGVPKLKRSLILLTPIHNFCGSLMGAATAPSQMAMYVLRVSGTIWSKNLWKR